MNTNETQLPEQLPPAENPAPAARRAYSSAFFLPALLFIVDFIVIFILQKLIDTSQSVALQYIVGFMPMYLIAFPCCVLAARLVPKMPPDKHSLSPVRIMLYFFICQFLAIAGNFIGIIVNAVLSVILGVNTSATFLQEGILGEQPLLFCFIAVCCAPVVEELLFRKLLIDRIHRYGNRTAIIISGLLFGLFHGNFTQFFYATLIGFLFAYVYTSTGKIQYTILLHMLLNFFGTAVPMLVNKRIDNNALMESLQAAMDTLQQSLLSGQAMDEANQQLNGLLGEMKPLLIMAAVNYGLAFAGLITLIVRRKHFKIEPPVTPLPKRTHLSVIFINLGILFAAAVCIFQFINQIYGIV